MKEQKVNSLNNSWHPPQRSINPDYQLWIQINEQNDLFPHILKEELESPLFTIVTPVKDPALSIIHATIQSVLAQSYQRWEWILADASVPGSPVSALLEKYSRHDPRIKIIRLEKNHGIAENTNIALKNASGEWVGFLDHDDLLAPIALAEMVSKITEDPKIDLLYSDEDFIYEDGSNRRNPHFKPDFCPDFLLSLNYITHFLVVRRSLGESIDWIRPGFDGAQDYDLILRAVEKTRKVTHIPKILYHWREARTSTARDITVKPYADEAGKHALADALVRRGLAADVQSGPIPTSYRVSYHIEGQPFVSILIPNQEQPETLRRCIHSIQTLSTYANYEIIVIENGSSSPEIFHLYKELQEKSIKVLHWDADFNYASVNNFAVQRARGEFVLFLNNDTEIITKDWIEQLLMHAQRKDVGAVGAKLYYPDHTLQHAGVVVGMGGVAGHLYLGELSTSMGYFGRLQVIQNYSAVTGACLMVQKKKFEEAGGFDERFQFAYNDVDFCLRLLEKDYRNVWTPYAELFHHESLTRGAEDSNSEKHLRFCREARLFITRWKNFIQKHDPCFNPNLSYDTSEIRVNPLGKIDILDYFIDRPWNHFREK
ncbi:glycosyltransferase family 2 protein [Flexilinea flocculi]|uniref:Glycosyltransferase, GT2 family n=1 Tax=Flexilinea flocculi TaxID=1678840 RepID=A0A0K8P8W7_9CHLR|nr:glycosyltransferase family 2 protein [Flexilinea flocculi]GAP39088.1 glycosyltransferase, GT2 family [Flexilinea flocculi]